MSTGTHRLLSTSVFLLSTGFWANPDTFEKTQKSNHCQYFATDFEKVTFQLFKSFNVAPFI